METDTSTRVEKKGKRYYKRNTPKPPITMLIPLAVETFKQMFPPEGDDPSVTTILGVLAKPALIGWAAREERKMVSAHAGRLYKRLHELLDGQVEPAKFAEMLNEELGKGAHRQLLEKAASVGSQVHARIEWELKGEMHAIDPFHAPTRADEPPPLSTDQAKRSFERWGEWRRSVNLKVLRIEQRLHSSLFGYGGTLDLLAEIQVLKYPNLPPEHPNATDRETRQVVIDFKTGKSVYGEAFLQNVAYRMALMEDGVVTQGGIIVRLPKYEEDPDFDAVDVPDDPRLGPTFIALRLAYGWWAENEERGKKKGKK